jgi:pyruvate/2-oxoglutarate/acetoin dehydrogenase E1 component
MSPFDIAVNLEMRKLAKMPETIFVGQSVAYDGAAIHTSLEGVPAEKRLEMPVAEEFQMGYCIGLSIAGKLPICIYPRMDFMLLCVNQLVNHLDKLPLYGWAPKVIIRTTVGKKKPLDAGPQHTQNYTEAFQKMLHTVAVREVRVPQEIAFAYDFARKSDRSTLIVENEWKP